MDGSEINLLLEKRNLGFEFQDFAPCPMTVFENMALGKQMRKDTADLQWHCEN